MRAKEPALLSTSRLNPTSTLMLVLRNKAIPKDAGNLQGAIGRNLNREPEHLVDLVTLLRA
jgi:hypothetical protein